MIDKLEKIEARYQEVERLLATSEVLADSEQLNKLAKELSDLKEPVYLYRDYKKLIRDTVDLEGMLKEKHDNEFVDLAKKELADLKSNKQVLEDKI
ncbi:MAG: PCRF domain-containing protein, partial [Candidatus Omnitrophica bacterium]|nr:PCRF domain-containing protein [Candidatus Omnitrophota bacterium]